MKTETIDFFINYIKQNSGIILTKDKSYLLESRLLPVSKKHNFSNIDDMAQYIKNRSVNTISEDVVDAMTTNESFFFRDGRPFEQFQKTIVPEIMRSDSAKKKFRIWCAACSTGQEPYSLAMILDEIKSEYRDVQFEILATDLSHEALERAKKGIFTQFEVQRGLSTKQLVKNFRKQQDYWQILPEIKKYITFKKVNLLNINQSIGKFDVIFLRNVLIYFDIKTKKEILECISKMISNEGFICLGGTETILGITDQLTPCRDLRGLYKKALSANKVSAAIV